MSDHSDDEEEEEEVEVEEEEEIEVEEEENSDEEAEREKREAELAEERLNDKWFESLQRQLAAVKRARTDLKTILQPQVQAAHDQLKVRTQLLEDCVSMSATLKRDMVALQEVGDLIATQQAQDSTGCTIA
eukprot:TRINITY_DN67817_c4_g4_i19.p2 TRINITY_DN67817_c4_g4~~TRINITY_DN67817_c4_g4_i19.p2  ORF type:complete len:131 (-),score=43.77 TRINITY_DN67817_c4_g4_i19:1630-2022(-)